MKYYNRNDYRNILIMVADMDVRTLAESHTMTGVVNIRHDVDDDLQAAVDMAEMEAEFGMKATYFFLDTAPYWKRDMRKSVARIAKLGHEIGWHNNAISNHLLTGLSLRNCIEGPLSVLSKIAPVVGTASHGDRLCYQHGYLNYYAFGLHRADNLQKFPNLEEYSQFSLSEFGLEYEAYFTGHTHYISESGGQWYGDCFATFQDFKEKGGKLQILIHPQWWHL